MIFLLQYQCDRETQAEVQAFFANMTDEQIAKEYPEGVKQICRYHDVPNGNGVVIVDAANEETLTSFLMGWSKYCTWPVVKPVVDDDTARTIVKNMLAAQGAG